VETDDMILDYCPVCDEDTAHVIVNDPIFGKALECTECNTVWETNWDEEMDDDD